MSYEPEVSGGAYQKCTISFGGAGLPSITEAVLYDAGGSGLRQRYVVDETGTFQPVHDCSPPVEPDVDGPAEWTCGDCSKAFDLHAEAWYEPRNE